MSGEDEWDAAYTADPDPDTEAASEEHDSTESQPLYPDVETWVRDYLAPIIARPQTHSVAWCPEWWRHAEAIARLEALWRAWEYLRLDGTTGPSVWWRDHLEPHLTVLCDVERSPFADCHNGHKDTLEPLPVEPAPPGWWGEPDQDG